MKRAASILSISICLLLIISSSPYGLSKAPAYSIGDPYQYPVTPASSEWKEMASHDERVMAYQIPDDYLSSMNTSALIETIANYPLLIDVLLFSNAKCAYQTIHANFNAIREMERREDAFSELTLFIETNEEIKSDYTRRTALEVIALSADFPANTASSRCNLDYRDAYELYRDLAPSPSLV